MELEIVWPAIPYFVFPIARIEVLPLVGHLLSVHTLARHCCSVAVSPRLKFTCTNEYPFVDKQNPCANSCLLP